MVDAAGHMDRDNHALRRVSKAGEVSTLAGNGEEGFAYGQGDARTHAEWWQDKVTSSNYPHKDKYAVTVSILIQRKRTAAQKGDAIVSWLRLMRKSDRLKDAPASASLQGPPTDNIIPTSRSRMLQGHLPPQYYDARYKPKQ
jgi:hypothetical protein